MISRRAVLWRVVKHPYEYHENDALKKPGAHPPFFSCSKHQHRRYTTLERGDARVKEKKKRMVVGRTLMNW